MTQAACDLSKSADVMTAVKGLACALYAGLDHNAVKLAIIQVRARVQFYEIPENIDLVDFCTLLIKNPVVNNTLKTACRKVIDTVTGPTGIVIKAGCKGSSVKNSYGLAIYFPTINLSPLYSKLDFTRKTGWGAFLNKYLTESKKR